MVADGKMGWDDPVRKHVDWFRLSDRPPTATSLCGTCSPSALDARHDYLWFATDNATDAVHPGLREGQAVHVVPLDVEYANVTFTTAGIASGLAPGATGRRSSASGSSSRSG